MDWTIHRIRQKIQCRYSTDDRRKRTDGTKIHGHGSKNTKDFKQTLSPKALDQVPNME